MGRWPDLNLAEKGSYDVALLLTKVLRHMNPIAQWVWICFVWFQASFQIFRLGFSLLSEKSKNRISLLRIFSDEVSISVCAYKRKEKLTLRLRNSLSSLEVHKCGPDLVIDLQNWREIIRLSFRREMSLRQWIDHCMELATAKRIDELTLSSIKKKHKYDLKGFHKSLAGLHIRELWTKY